MGSVAKKLKITTFDSAIDAALAQAMVADDRIIVFGEDVQTMRAGLTSRFGKDRVMSTPISEAGFVGAAVSAAMAGLRPVVEIMLVDFSAVMEMGVNTNRVSGVGWHIFPE